MWHIPSTAHRVHSPEKNIHFHSQLKNARVRAAPVSPQSPMRSPSLLPISPLPQFRRPSMTQLGPGRERKKEREKLVCSLGWDIPHCSFTQGLCNADGSRDVALQRPWEARALSSPQWLPRSNLIMQALCLRKDTQTGRQMGRQGDQQTDRETRITDRQGYQQTELLTEGQINRQRQI